MAKSAGYSIIYTWGIPHFGHILATYHVIQQIFEVLVQLFRFLRYIYRVTIRKM